MGVVRILLIFLFSLTALAQSDPKLAGIVVVSDFHLYDPDYQFDDGDTPRQALEHSFAEKNESSYRRMLEVLGNQKDVSAVIMNGDIFHAPSTKNLTPKQRIDRMLDVLFEMARTLKKPIHFNLGNHDILMEVVNGDFKTVPGFAQDFEKALAARVAVEKLDVGLIGAGDERLGDYHAVYEIEVGGKKIHIAHAPFVSTDEIEKQAELFKDSNPRAFEKVTNPPRLKENLDRIIYIQSDSHTPGYDQKLNVYNTGMLTVDDWVPFKESTFLVIGEKGATHFAIERGPARAVTKFVHPNCSKYFQ